MWQQIKEALAQSTARFLTRFADLLPGTAALILAVLVSIVVGIILAAIVRRLLMSMKFDQRLSHWGFPSLSEWSPSSSPTLLVSRAASRRLMRSGLRC
jgi:hypothetical protein